MPAIKGDFVKLQIPPWPEYISSSYRNFYQNEKHITRICDFYVLIFMFERTLIFTEDKKECVLNKGEWYIQRPGPLQEGLRGSPAPSYYYIHFYAQGIICDPPSEEDYSDTLDHNLVILKKHGTFDDKLMKPLLDQLDFCSRNKPFDKLTLQSLFLSILNTIALPSQREDSNGLAQQIFSFITENYNDDINCDIIADNYHFSTEYINRKLKQYCGQTPGQLLQYTRITKAKELLYNTDHTLTDISSAVGYHDVTVFYKAFRKITGSSPGRWREGSRGIQ